MKIIKDPEQERVFHFEQDESETELLQAKKENETLGKQLFDLQTLLIEKGVI